MQSFSPSQWRHSHIPRRVVHFFILLTLICSSVFVLSERAAPVQAMAGQKTGQRITKFTAATVNTGQLKAQQAIIDKSGATVAPSTVPLHKFSNPSRVSNPNSPHVASIGGAKTSAAASGGAVQASGALATTLTPGINFTAAAGHDDADITPPDTMGDVGPTQYTLAINGRIRSFNKATGIEDGAIDVSTDTFFFALRQDAGVSDPHIRFDRFSNRWFITAINVANNSNLIMFAVSTTDTITSATNWDIFAFNYDQAAALGDPQAGIFFDYPVTGIDTNAIYIGGNIFNNGGFFVGSTVVVIQKSSVLALSPVINAFYDVSTGTSGIYTPHGVDNDDPSAPTGFFLGVDLQFTGQLDMLQVNNPGTASPTLTGPISIVVPSTNGPTVNAPSKGAAFLLDDSDSRIMEARVRNHTLWASHVISVNQNGTSSSTDSPADDRTGVRWYQLDNIDSGTPLLNQAGTIFDPTNTATPLWYTYGSLVPNGQGHVAFGMTQTGQAAYADAAYTGRLFTDPPGYTNAPPVPYTNASTPYTGFDGPQLGFFRWGDWSMTSVDPCDDQTFYTAQMYTHDNLPGNPIHWGVQVQQLIAPPPPKVIQFNAPSLKQGTSATNLVVTGTSASGAAFFNGNSVAACATHLEAFATGGIAINGLTYNNPTQITLNVSTVGALVGPQQITIINPDGQSTVGTINVTNSAPTTLIVTNLTDNPAANSGSLRDVINRAPDGAIVKFQAGLTGTINLLSANGELFIAKNLTIAGPGARVITINAGGTNRIFDIGGAYTYTIYGLTLTGGNADAASYPAGGGAIENNGGTVNLYDMTFTGNSAANPGGAIDNLGGIVYISRSTFTNNTSSGATGRGGAIYSRAVGNTVVTIVNSTFTGNSAPGVRGGAIRNDATMTLINDTISGNSAAFGGNIYNSLGGGTLYLQNTIVANGTATGGTNSGPDIFGSINTLGYNNVLVVDQGMAFLNFDPSDQLGQNPLLGTLQNNGGPTDTMLPANGSPVVNKIPVNLLPQSLDGSGLKDQRGFIRPGVVGGNGTIGAVEVGSRFVPIDLLGIYNAGAWYLRAADGSTLANPFYGGSNWIPVTGDWNGDGITKLGIYNNGAWYLLNDDNTTLYTSFFYGGAGWLPVVGDWTGTGHAGIGIYQNGAWYLRNTLAAGPADISFFYGGTGWLPVVGDWSGIGHAGMGIYQNGAWYLRNTLSYGPADYSFSYGASGWTPVTGHWTGLPNSGIGIYQHGAWYLHNIPSGGPADETVFYGATPWLPVVGDWAMPSIAAAIPKSIVTPTAPPPTSLPPTFQPPIKKTAQ